MGEILNHTRHVIFTSELLDGIWNSFKAFIKLLLLTWDKNKSKCLNQYLILLTLNDLIRKGLYQCTAKGWMLRTQYARRRQ
jgi:hypothetical protein